MVLHICDRCKQPFANATSLRNHKNRKNPCLMVSMPVDKAIEEHKRIVEVLDSAVPTAPPTVQADLKEEVKEQAKEFRQYTAMTFKADIDLRLDAKTGNSTVLLGASKSGKSTLLMYLYRKYYEKTVAVLFTESPQIPLYTRQRKLVIANNFYRDLVREAHKINKNTKNKYPFTFLVDDVVDQKDNVTLKKMMLILRNSNISSLISLQSMTLMNKQSRGSVNNYIFFRFNTDEQIKTTIEAFLMSHLPGPMEQKIKTYKAMTADHGFIYYNPREDAISLHRLPASQI